MSWITRSARAAGLAVCVLAAMVIGAGAPAAAAEEYVKYYAVTSSYRGQPENLTEIAARFLGDGARSAEILNLNIGRKQPDGKRLDASGKVRAGWLLVLPWDAVGDGVKQGALPDKAPTTAVQPKPKKTKGKPKTQPPVPPERIAQAAAVPTKPPKQKRASKRGECAAAAASSSRSQWASLRLAADQAWPQSRGKGQVIAIIDSGVDGGLPALSGRVATGLDMVTGTGRGDTDCLGSGTAMAGLIVAQPGKGGDVKGVAPEATVMPVRVVGSDSKVQPTDGAAAIEAATGAGATVIALGKFVDTSRPAVAKAIMAAVERDVVVVAGAALGSVPVDPAAKLGAGVLRVGGVGIDHQRAADYRSGGVDVVAPGINVNSIGITGVGSVAGSGTQYAVAFVAGAAVLVRAAYPDLTAEQVAHRIQVTSDKLSDTPPPDGRFGYGMINPAAAVTKVLPEEAADDAAPGGEQTRRLSSNRSGPRSTLLAIVTLVALAAALLLVFRIRRLLREGADDDTDGGGDDDGPGAVTFPPGGARPGGLPPASIPLAPSVSRQSEQAPPADDGDEPTELREASAADGSEPPTEKIPEVPKASAGARSPQRPDAP